MPGLYSLLTNQGVFLSLIGRIGLKALNLNQLPTS
ncbi:hypothetical protein BCF53_104144 [Reinekea marinisedimentorum]|uniref:Uncharacterized protein n=1 Tax=Reinekea marinisedimentorum TaxID=230495 RepID=A0A4R3I9I2_9GAMM|nr:hypothetical protein BCF53_104144 [Reinekea marinisedimentorum]